MKHMNKTSRKNVKLLEATLRDGSYDVNFTFTSEDTSALCKALEEVGFEYIEVGHGVGLNASNMGYGKAVQTDEEYMVAAKKVLKKAKYGMFCIPGIARLEDIDLAHKHGMGFIRIGTNITEVANSEQYIKRAKKLGMFVTANYMKSYAVPPNEFAKQVKLSQKYGVDLIYIVDSAGGMFAEDIERYYRAARKVTGLPLGFHGHDNLGLAVSNSLFAADLGIEFIDTTLQALGRSAGNACTEVVVAALLKRGYKIPIDLLKVLEVGQKYIQPLISQKGRMPLDTIAGYAEFHSSYMPKIQKYSAKYRVDPALLIIEMCKIDKVNVDENILDSVAKKLKTKGGEVYLGKYRFNRYIGNEQDKRK
ncbi:MAG: 4-hydroxy-2-oxovalerate aldolase [Candidatus Wildermuthbacteria bacterium]|nr:4-hydroxy-2-oxovalerate aldolase [Candidatus Wildermuthbacteria bacterium]